MWLVNFKGSHRYFLAVDVDIRLVSAGTPISWTQYSYTDGVVRRRPVWFYPGLVIHNSECFSVLADMNSHCKIDFLSGRGILEVNLGVNPGGSCVFKSAGMRRVFQRYDVGGTAAKKRELGKTCVE